MVETSTGRKVGRLSRFWKQCVMLEGHKSSESQVVSAVSEETFLVTLVFLLYITDIVEHLLSTFLLFADDCFLCEEISFLSDIRHLHEDLHKHELHNTWQMQFNETNCYLMHVLLAKSHTRCNYSLCNHTLESASSYQYLEFHVDKDLGWSTHIGYVTSKASYCKTNPSHCLERLRQNLYISLVCHLLEYAAVV